MHRLAVILTNHFGYRPSEPETQPHPHLSSSSVSRPSVWIVSACRSPIGSFGGGLSSLHAAKLMSPVVTAAVQRASLEPSDIQEAILGNVISAGLGQVSLEPSSLQSHMY